MQSASATAPGLVNTTTQTFAGVKTLTNPVVGTQSQGDSSTKAASTAYVDVAVANAVAGVNPAVAVQAATTSSGDTSGYTYSNGVAGVGATLTAGASNTPLTVDGYTFTAIGQRLLVKDNSTGAYNGIYSVTQVQALALPVILTRALDYNTPTTINNTGAIPVVNGTVNGTTSWVQTAQITTVGTDPLVFVEFTRNPADYVLKSTFTAKGSLVTATAASTPVEQTVGANNTVLVADSAQTNGMKWIQLVNANIDAAAAIAYSKLSLTGSIVNADINASAAIAYSKLSLSNSILNADINSSAAIARSKLASGTANHVIINDSGGAFSSEANLAVSRGGTGLGTLVAHALYAGNGTSAMTQVGLPGSANAGYLLSGTSSADPSFTQAPTLGGTGGITGQLSLAGLTSGSVTIKPADAAGTYSFILPITVGASGDLLTSGAGGTTAMTWSTPASANTASAIVKRDGSGNFSAGTITATLTGTASTATNIAGGAGGSIPYQSAADTTVLLANGTAGQVLKSAGTTLAPVWTATPATVPSQIVRGTCASKGGSTSGETTVVNYSASIISTGSDITFTARTTTTGDKYTINTAGVYCVWLSYQGAAADNIGITVNSSGLSTSVQSLTASQVPCSTDVPATNRQATLCMSFALAVNDVVRVQTEAASTPGGATTSRFGIARVS